MSLFSLSWQILASSCELSPASSSSSCWPNLTRGRTNLPWQIYTRRAGISTVFSSLLSLPRQTNLTIWLNHRESVKKPYYRRWASTSTVNQSPSLSWQIEVDGQPQRVRFFDLPWQIYGRWASTSTWVSSICRGKFWCRVVIGIIIVIVIMLT